MASLLIPKMEPTVGEGTPLADIGNDDAIAKVEEKAALHLSSGGLLTSVVFSFG